MSIPTTFHNSNCQSPYNLGGGGMLQFCKTFNPATRPPSDYCEIFTQDDYNMYQLGCINGRAGTFVDNNNNTVAIERPAGMVVSIDSAVEFVVGSRDQYVFIPFN
ncbi:hypothetical protein EC988_001440 [Linderina pennispora]|nr:hypothetical protein EC988_001440 [Linderina pennispora]